MGGRSTNYNAKGWGHRGINQRETGENIRMKTGKIEGE